MKSSVFFQIKHFNWDHARNDFLHLWFQQTEHTYKNLNVEWCLKYTCSDAQDSVVRRDDQYFF